MTTKHKRQKTLVGIVDSGFSPLDHNHIAAAQQFTLQPEDKSVIISDADIDHLGHGTALANTIWQQASDIPLCIAQVFGDTWATSAAQVATAIDWLVSCDVAVINLSLGLQHDRTILREACTRALDAGVILVASTPAQGNPVYPARYHGVIRATGDARCELDEISWLDSPQADFGAYVKAQGSKVVGASASAAHLSGHIARHLNKHQNADQKQVMQHLQKSACFIGPERIINSPERVINSPERVTNSPERAIESPSSTPKQPEKK